MSRTAGQAVVGRQIQLPLRKAFAISLESIRIRFWRSVITAGGIFLGIAFLVSVLTTSLVQQHLPGTMDAAAQAAAKNRQIWLVIMSLVVCTVGITNSMLMSVTERFKEIGTMKCLGALDIFVVELFLLESGVLGIVASFAGWLAGFGSIWLLAMGSHGWAVAGSIRIVQILTTLGIGIGTGMVLTVIATIPPAIRAAKMPPAMALRTEI
ncbi:MAG TPA: FtsX-like permease family protein [Armatimonadota bacterium]|nr:FtsX-like permease family protein [Armatimonadota bacterium]